MYFRGTDDKVWRVKTDGTDASNPHGFKTQSDVLVAADGYMYFRGPDDKAWRVRTYGNDASNPHGFKTQSNVFVAADASMFFPGTHHHLFPPTTPPTPTS